MAAYGSIKSLRLVKACSLVIFCLVCLGFMLSFQQMWLQRARVGLSPDVPGVSRCKSSSVPPLEARWRELQHPVRHLSYNQSNTQSLVAIDPTSEVVGPTSVKTTTCKLISPLTPRVGDTLHFHIEARNVKGHPIKYGGDFWFGVLESPKLKASTASRIIDHHNGTYSLYFLAGWAGDVRVRIILVHPSAAIDYLRNSFRHAEEKVLWNGVFISKGLTEKSTCWISYNGNTSNACIFQPQRALRHTLLVCNPPASLPCSKLVGVVGATSYSHQFQRVLAPDKAYLFTRPYVNAPLAFGKPITIRETIDEKGILDPQLMSLPICQPDLSQTLSDGFWYKDRWNSLVCQPRVKFSINTIRECLQGQNIYLTGDSTTRQWFAEIAKSLNLGSAVDREFKNKSFHLLRTDKKNNIKLEFIFHPLSLHPSSVFVNLSVVRFEADVLLSLAKTPCQSAIVVISPWAHFPNYPWGSYLDWLEGIYDAYSYLKRTCPDIKLIVKTPHPVNMQWEMKARDWMFYQMKQAMWKVFKGSGAFFVDVWDMNLSYLSAPINMHMPSNVVKEELSLFLSHACQR
ncbi:NXPE family member 3-like [Lytechinus variegatus]|uniref:NXPE family member 3-like n=1 Tax=Lytechinus variegatus TaxID=7654 RepID=UPI001BB27ACA|nr:NXPE family member 3-like [Lytechinus variegatus]